jgi:lipoprotein-anchoring transpeptidase ErfK/SrfK
VTDKLRMGGPGTTYGCCAIALSAHQAQLPQGWTGLDRIAVHGTQSPQTIGAAASLGCMHASDGDLRRLMRIVPVGAPVFVRA